MDIIKALAEEFKLKEEQGSLVPAEPAQAEGLRGPWVGSLIHRSV